MILVLLRLKELPFKCYTKEHTMITVNQFISLSEGKTVSGRFSIDWTKTFEGIKIPHRKQDCLDCYNGKNCCDCNRKLEVIVLNAGWRELVRRV